MEADVGVPYRSWITFQRQVRQANDEIRSLTIRLYAKKPDEPKITDLTIVETTIDKAGHGRFVPLANGNRRSHCISLDLLKQMYEKS